MAEGRNGMTSAIQPHNERAAATWGAGGAEYDEISRTIANSIEHCMHRLGPGPGERVLDLATGTGWAARLAAAGGAKVVGVDIGADLIEAAKERARQANLDIKFEVGDAEQLRFDDESFDVVVSTCGVMFASNPEAAAAEIARVCRRGGRVGLTTWPPEGTLAQMFQVMRPYMPPPPRQHRLRPSNGVGLNGSESCSDRPSISNSRPARPCCASPTASRSGASSRPATVQRRPSRANSTLSGASSCTATSSRSTNSSGASSGWPCHVSTCLPSASGGERWVVLRQAYFGQLKAHRSGCSGGAAKPERRFRL